MNTLEAHSQTMDKVYGWQKAIYDATRKYYLLGRDKLLDEVAATNPNRVLEVGCGTARNLIKLARKSPAALLRGIDASGEMLSVAKAKIHSSELTSRIKVERAFAEDVHFQRTFGMDSPFDTVFLSYSISMISSWQKALENASQNVAKDGSLFIVDFWDQASYPRWFKSILSSWLRAFHVDPRLALRDYLICNLAPQYKDFNFQPLFGGYCVLARLSGKF